MGIGRGRVRDASAASCRPRLPSVLPLLRRPLRSISSPGVLPRFSGTALLTIGLLAASACSTASPRRDTDGSTFLARQYLQRGHAAWAAGNEPNARFLVGRAVELDPTSEALAFWQARWPIDSLPPAAREALASAGGIADPSDPGAPPPSAGRAPGQAAEPTAADPAAGGTPGFAEADTSVAPFPLEDLAAARAGEGGAETPPPGPAVGADELAARRAAFDRARAASRAPELARAGRELIAAWPQHLPTVHRVLAAWIEARAESAAAEHRVRGVLASLEFGDADYLAGKPDETSDAEWLRGWRGRFLDLLGWSAFLRGDLAQAEAALRSAENEINLRGPGEVTHLRPLASFYERRGDLRRAESYAIAAAARDESGSGEVRAAAARLWTRRHSGTAGLEARLRAEEDRVRREERAAAIANRRYEPLPAFSAPAADGTTVTNASLRGHVTLLVLWEPGCDDCVRLLRTLAGEPPGSSAPARGWAAVRVVALDLGGDLGEARRAAGALSGVIVASAPDPRPLAQGLDAGRLPVTLLVEPAGFVQYRHVGFPEETAARRRWLERLEWQVEGLRGLSAAPRTGRPADRRPGRSDGAS